VAPLGKIKQIWESFKQLHPSYHRWILLGSLFLITVMIMSLLILPDRASVQVGKPSPETVYAPRDAIDYYATEKLREEAAAQVPEVYDYDPSVLEEVKQDLETFFQKSGEIAGRELTPEEQVLLLEKETGLDLPPAQVTGQFISLDGETASEIQGRVIQVVEEILQQGVKSEGIETARRQAIQGINLLPYQPEIRQVLERVVLPLIQPNMFYNPEATEANREKAREGIEPVRIQRGALIISAGEIATEAHIAQMEALGLRTDHISYSYYLGILLLVMTLLAAGTFYIYHFRNDIYDDVKLLILLSLILVINLILAAVVAFFSPFLIPAAMGAMVVTIFFNPSLALVYVLIQSVLIGVLVGGEFTVTVVVILGSLTGVYAVQNLQRRGDLTKAAGFIAIANTVAFLGLFLIREGFWIDYDLLIQLGTGVGSCCFSGLFAAIFTIGLLPYLESAFGLVTPITLLELSNPNQPLLRRLMREAPGTYHHSLMVGNLAEAAAEAVNADALLVRVASLYHDIGKLSRPYFFVENQIGKENPHRQLTPALSRLVIANHVKDGLKLADEAKLPKAIKDIIEQHHGKSRISFFYQQAMEQSPQDYAGMEQAFRYPGPLPQTREAGIVMLADSVEAASRSLTKRSGGKLEAMVHRIVWDKEGQLENCDLTFRDLDEIEKAFIRVLTGIYHQRIQYPEIEEKEEADKNDIENQQQNRQAT